MSKYTDKLVMILVLVVVVMAFGMGAMWSKLQTIGQASQAKQADQATQAKPAQPKVDINTIKGCGIKMSLSLVTPTRRICW